MRAGGAKINFSVPGFSKGRDLADPIYRQIVKPIEDAYRLAEQQLEREKQPGGSGLLVAARANHLTAQLANERFQRDAVMLQSFQQIVEDAEAVLRRQGLRPDGEPDQRGVFAWPGPDARLEEWISNAIFDLRVERARKEREA